MNYQEALAYLEGLNVFGVRLGLSRIQRLLERDGISYEHAALRIRAQKPESYFREKCDHVLENNGTEAEFQEKCLAFFRQFIIMK